MGVKVYYYVVAAVLGFGFLIPQHGNKKKNIYRTYGDSAYIHLRLAVYVPYRRFAQICMGVL